VDSQRTCRATLQPLSATIFDLYDLARRLERRGRHRGLGRRGIYPNVDFYSRASSSRQGLRHPRDLFTPIFADRPGWGRAGWCPLEGEQAPGGSRSLPGQPRFYTGSAGRAGCPWDAEMPRVR